MPQPARESPGLASLVNAGSAVVWSPLDVRGFRLVLARG
jgi:hypothetical protein